ncbi:hypothetical protein [Nocardia australiensis]|uniref:hypothetical protein n=1 Tax=Nocardia australiensis TaxID=2887191 RepID=UPI001D150BFF|nr:hypothetical protein [Nocardia australiensis]
MKRAIGFLRHDISGSDRDVHERAINDLAAAEGYQIDTILAVGPDVTHPLSRILVAVSRIHADAVITPGPDHVADFARALLVVTDLITIAPPRTARRGVRHKTDLNSS